MQIAYMIYEHFRATGVRGAVQGLSDLFKKRLQTDDVQDLDTRWDRAPLAASETPTKRSWKDCTSQKLQVSVQLQTVLVMYEQENVRHNEQPIYSRMKTIVLPYLRSHFGSRAISVQVNIVAVSDHVFHRFLLIS